MTRKPDDVVGSRGAPAAGGGHQTPEQDAITRQEPGGRTEQSRNAEWSEAGGTPGRPPVSVGGSSGGHSDQKAADGPREGEKTAAGHYRTEQTGGKVDW
ncbi:hypothetical protein OPKNFCMD_0279 [Methylobacterium crusticola]|uniref:Stress-induced protein n=1 Tax=Methylobacterium crusticola TaxID=1697972 RepID=A0ABQ4QSB3_9HYPH|nr:hypothetical protein [Methylobacterium crusticola]GJD47571.1 hypothetical protein OPKNFCMD_0279 [Methylobacterium crusticola]